MEKIKSYIKFAIIVVLIFWALTASSTEANKSKIAQAKKEGVQICQYLKLNPNRIACVDSNDKNYVQDSLEKFGLDYNICIGFVKEKFFDETSANNCNKERSQQIVKIELAKIK